MISFDPIPSRRLGMSLGINNIPLLSHIPIHEKVRDYCDEGEVQKIVDDSILSQPFNDLVNKIK
ncbi:MAG: hypothetical protein ACOCWB_06225 [Bacteroidota bacterium]